MAPEHDARTRAFYDHESDEQAPARRRRAAADWGVNEDIFDRMPSRRFKRTDRRAEHRDEPSARFERRTSGPSAPRATEWADDEPRYDDWADAHERRQVAPRRDDWAEAAPRRAAEWEGEEPRRAAEWEEPRRDERARAQERADAPRRAAEWEEPRRDDRARAQERADAPRRAAEPGARRPRIGERRPAESWTAGDEGSVEVEGKRPIQSWLEPERGESRTIVLERSEPADIAEVIAEPAPQGRKTVTITGHPDWTPAPRTQRPPRTAIERIGARPDRIAGYAVLLGFMLILIAVLTTGQ
jgi:hypothetical protein